MHVNKFLTLLLLTFFPLPLVFGGVTLDSLPFPSSAKEKIKKHKIVTTSVVNNYIAKDKIKHQTMDFKSAGLHKKTCSASIPRMFNYESYKDKIDMVQVSTYDDTLGRIHIIIKAPVIKRRFGINFKIPRIKKPGSYPFVFDRGFLKDLNGTIHVYPHKNFCLYFIEAKWDGPHSGYPNFILGLFSKMAMDISSHKLFRISGSN